MNDSRFGQLIDLDYIGLSGPTFECPIELGKIQEFARATGALLPDYLSNKEGGGATDVPRDVRVLLGDIY